MLFRSQKKLAVIDKSMETIHAKMDGFSTAMKNQLSFNKALETQLVQLAAATPAAELGKIPGATRVYSRKRECHQCYVERAP